MLAQVGQVLLARPLVPLAGVGVVRVKLIVGEVVSEGHAQEYRTRPGDHRAPRTFATCWGLRMSP